MRNTYSPFFIGALLVTAGLAATPAQADDTGGEQWQFEVTPYLFAAGMKGTVGARGVTADVDVSFSDIAENLDAGFLGLFEARKGPWTFGVDAIYLKLSIDAMRTWQGPLGNGNTATLDATFKQQLYQPFVGYRVLDGTTKIDLIAGARYTSLDPTVRLTLDTGAALLPDGSRSVSTSKNWWDAVVGVRLKTPIADKWAFAGYADIGAGGSDLTYQVAAGVNWQFAKDYSVKIGYRYLAQDYQKDGFLWDVKMSGPYVGLGIVF
jgi:hypothetical protein